jgi:hypothetical protein
MNKFITSVTTLNANAVKEFLNDPKWISWSEPTGKNALHYLCGIPNLSNGEKESSLKTLKLLLKSGMDIDSIHLIKDEGGGFPATPLWYAYTRGRNEKLYKYLLKQRANPDHCWWAISWYDDVEAGKLWLKHGAKIDARPTLDDLFVGTFAWKRYNFAKWLLDQGADINAFGPNASNALTLAVKRKDEDAIKFLRHHNADPNLKNNQGISARSIAESKGPRRLLDLL